ncbi:MAG TPA: universal stress protein [Pseudonocardiaceae bacterium]|jgi:nucleotide-binding universal stress UspA family protein|nr:universal stress protein [Pseudonocardiaceae bacterium]
MVEDRPILVGVDGSRYSREALRWALAEADRRDCAVRAVLVWHTEPIVAAGRPTVVGAGARARTDPAPEYLRRLDNAIREVLDEQDDPRLTADVVQGATTEVLAVASRQAQLLVLGSHGHGRLFEVALGTIAQSCVRHAACPVVIVPASLADREPVLAAERGAAPLPLTYGPGPLL